MVLHDFPLIPRLLCYRFMLAFMQIHMRSWPRVTRQDGRCVLEDTRGVVSRRKSSLQMQKLITITIRYRQIDRIYDAR